MEGITDADVLLSTDDVVVMVSTSKRSLRRWVQEKSFPPPAVSKGRTIRWTLAQVRAWAAIERVTLPPPPARVKPIRGRPRVARVD